MTIHDIARKFKEIGIDIPHPSIGTTETLYYVLPFACRCCPFEFECEVCDNIANRERLRRDLNEN